MSSQTQTPLTEAIGLALGQAHWNLAIDPDSAEVVDHTGGSDGGRPRLPVTDIDLHVTGQRGSLPDVFQGLLALLRRIAEGRRDRPTPIEQDYVTGYLRQLVSASTSSADRERLRAALDCQYRSSHAVRAALDTAWIAVSKT